MKNYNIIVRKGIDYKTIVSDLIKDYGTETIPNRSVEISEEWPNLDRLITVVLDDDEVEQLKQDIRIEHIEIPPEEDPDIIIGFDAIQEGDFSRVNSSTGSNLNWGMIRSNNATNIYGSGTSTVEDYEYVLDGEGVDVVIMDSGIVPDHPEFEDKDGLSRVQLIDWSAYGNGLLQPDYFYNDENGHGTHVAATVAGKTFGWAKKALIYSMRIQLGHPDGYTPTQGFNLIKAWHQSKPVDPYTGLKRPTIVNMSWGTGTLYPTSLKAGLTTTATGTYRGTPFNVSWTAPAKPSSTDLDYGFWPRMAEYGGGTNVRVSSYDSLTDELIDAGIHICIAAGNRGFKIDVPSGVDYNNDVTYAVTGTADGKTFDFTQGPYNYHRGSSPYSDRAFMVGAIDYRTTSGKDRTDGYTNRGPGVDLYSPGSGIKSAWTDETINRTTADRTIIESRSVSGSPYYANSSYYQRSIQGTSMATPQVTGVGALYLSASPQLTPAQLKSMILSDAKTNQLVDSGLDNDYNNIEGSLTGGANKTLFNRYSTSIHKQAIGGVGSMEVPYTPEVSKTISLSKSTVTFSETIPDTDQTYTSGIITLSGTPGTKIATIGEGGENFSFPNITEIPSVGYVNFRINFTPQYGPLQLNTTMTFIGPSNNVILNISGEVTNTVYFWKPRVTGSSNPNPNQFDETENFYMALFADMFPEPAAGSEVTYSITGIDENDVGYFSVNLNYSSVVKLTDTLIYDPDVWGRDNLYIFLRIREDNLTEGTETLTFTVNGNSVSANIIDTSTGSNPSYTLRTEPANTTELNEGDSVSIFVDYSNAPLNDTISWSVDNTKLSAEDLTVGSLTGAITLVNDASGPGYSGSVQLASFTIAEDATAEGQEQLDFSINKTDVTGLSIVINDTSVDYVYNFSITSSTTGPINEGDTIDITLTAEDGAPGTELTYTITGIDALDLSSGSLTGVFTLQEPTQILPGIALSDTLVFTIAEDATSELPETLTIALDDYPDVNFAIAITDTSKSPVSYTLSSSVTELNEGDTFSISLETTSVEIGSTIPYTITGITQDDLSSGSLTGSFTLVADPAEEGAGISSASFTLAADELTEGTETFILTITTQDTSTQSISIPVNDTSSAIEYRIVKTGPTSLVEDDSSSIIFWVYSSGPSDPLTYEIVGDVTDDDFVIESIYKSTSGSLLFSPRLSVDTKEPDMPYYAAKFFKLKADYLTEGDETLQFTIPEIGLSSEIYSVVDLSKTPTVSLQTVYDSRNEGLEYLAILTATGAPVGYTITGKLNVNPADLDLLELGGQTISLLNKTDPIPITFTVGNHGTTSGLNTDQTYIKLGLKEDSLTEGPETVSITLDDFAASLSFTINDTSQGIVTYTLTSPDTVAENSVTTIQISVSGINDTVSTIPFKIDTSSTISVNDIQKITDAGLANITPSNFTLGKQINVPVTRTSSTDPYTGSAYIYMKPNLTNNSTRTMVFSSFDGLASKSISVTDVNPIITVLQNKLNVNEGETVEFNIEMDSFGEDEVGNPLEQDFYIKFTKDGVDNTDFNSTNAQGEFIFTATSGQTSTFTLVAKDDATTEGDEVIDYEIGVVDGDVWYTSGQITIVDTSQSPTPVTYSLTRSIVSQPETSTATQRITLTTTGLDVGTVVPFTISGAGVTTSDFDRMYVNGTQFTVSLTHFFIILADGTSEITIYAAADQTTEGDETINLALNNGQASVNWIYQDDSIESASYELTTNKSVVNEGDSIIITLTYTNHSGLNYIIPTVSGAGFDVVDDTETSLISFSPLTIGGGPYTIIRSIAITEDLLTEGNETVTISIPGASTSFTIVDTSTTPGPTVSITTDKSSYNEGEIITFTLTYNNFTETSKTYRILRRGSSTNTGEEFTTGGNGVSFSGLTTGTGGPYTATRTLGTTEDQTTEGNEIFDIYDDTDYTTSLASFTIVDTSTTPEPTYSISSTTTSVNEGAIIIFDIATTNVAQGTEVTASLTPANRFSPSQITFTIEADGTDRVGTTVLENDNLDDTTSATITVDEDAEANYSFTINDTSTQPVTYQLASTKSSLAEGSADGDYITIITIQTTGLAVGTRIPYTISGASLSDFTPNQNRNGVSGVAMSLTGDFIIGTQVTSLPGYASFSLATVADALTEGNETVTVSLNNGEASVSFIINDTSTGAISATGGTLQTDGTYNYHVFISGGTFTVNSIGDTSYGNKVDVLLVGGAGGGGKAILLNTAATATGAHSLTNGSGAAGGGGGGGQVVEETNTTVSAGDSWTVSIGQGGAIAGDGTESSISGASSVSAGGGGGGDYSVGNASPTGTGGGGGGGVIGGSAATAYSGGAGSPAGGSASITNYAGGTTGVFGGDGGSNETDSVIYSPVLPGGGGAGGSNSTLVAPSRANAQPGVGGVGGNNPYYVIGAETMDPTKSYITNGQLGSQGIVVFRYRIQ